MTRGEGLRAGDTWPYQSPRKPCRCHSVGDLCDPDRPHGPRWCCVRERGHDGRHVSAHRRRINAAWDQPPPVVEPPDPADEEDTDPARLLWWAAETEEAHTAGQNPDERWRRVQHPEVIPVALAYWRRVLERFNAQVGDREGGISDGE